ncbi:coiled-coil domain-containing protein 103 [Cimex lectularius]|uniref:Coiled-coil domain-containing protein 103 n=1 Tax=Cimex lectularius TaxID=79782 RepID=A0A8I6R8R5_CIMLE|nr:coiled-coil domain-containing protein 103 [Cimex lectularius]
MARELSRVIDLTSLEEEVRKTVEADRLYDLQNKAKILAVTDRKVSSYEEFRDRVNAAHLRPLDKKDKIAEDGFKRVWNPIRSQGSAETATMSNQVWDEAPQTFHDILSRIPTPTQRYFYLRESGAEELSRGLRREVPVGVLGDIVEALSAFPNTTEDILFVVSVLDTISKTDRFRLSLDFLTCSEKDMVWSLMDKLTKSFNNRHQDLAEEGVTEWTVQGLREKYCVPGKRPQE